MSKTLTAWNSPAANAPVSSRNTPADEPAWPKLGSSSPSAVQPSSRNSSSTSAAASGGRRALGDVDAGVEHAGLEQRVGVLQHGAPGTASHVGSWPCRPMP